MKNSFTERGIIERIKCRVPVPEGDLLVGIGDDCSVVKRSTGILELFTVDTLVEGIHFDSSWHSPRLLGRKAVSVNISDVAAMGGYPRYALLSLGLPKGIDETWVRDFLDGFEEALGEFEVTLMGGDTVASPGGVMISVTLVGESLEGQVLLRNTAKDGDLILVSGVLGDAAAGLELYRMNKAGIHPEAYPAQIKAHLDPVPEIVLGQLLAESGLVHAMMDLSDGLATDLARLCEASGLGAEIAAETLPISTGAERVAEALACSALEWAIAGGEDYRLLLTIDPGNREKLAALVRTKLGRELFLVGRMISKHGVFLVEDGHRREISYAGFDHFIE
ncbi:MAG: thiamine-phosphate kinase [Proteobacteria bacterium]|nr:thiamine-phosphate kinase [Pseudomonadota bacterium]MBU1688421.1 thiamine-phosphate kinase [Pseudomonadota bacterium]